MPITPDTKNWTWVLDRPCPECGFDASTLAARDVSELVRENTAAWPAALDRADVRVRPDDSTWSPLEYGAHVRDVNRIYLYRLGLMLESDDPLFPNWDQDETAAAEKYNEQDPATVARELVQAGEAIAAAFDAVPDDAWQRPGRRSDGAAFTIDTLARYYIHDPVHHLWDVEKTR
jgi:hypothetical protein